MISAISLAGLDCRFEDVAAERSGKVLGVVEYSNRPAGPVLRDGHPSMSLSMCGAGEPEFAEVWRTSAEVTNGEYKGLTYAHDGEYLFCSGRAEEGSDYVASTENAYLAALELIAFLGYRHVVRVWNMVARINDVDDDGGNTYIQFCRGRANAFERHSVSANLMPAATCVGSHGGGIAFYFIACRTAKATNIENPRQVPAYEYPPKYGLKAPSFARATWLSTAEGDGSDYMFISGTASILGSKTVYEGDIEGQCVTTLDNISVLVGSENLARYGIDADLTLKDLDCVKVYVKRGADMAVVKRICSPAFADHAQVAYVNVDICRDDLLVEIEGIVPPGAAGRMS
ncbi:FkbO/Hyg5 family chorismatase [Streptosporangium sp. KLBMP 9127]|nr:FkbO/Hyg5 family chorismatase [Streptosporangium sp. KLBMP 9127]